MNCTKPVERMNYPPFTMSICNIYDQIKIYIRYHSFNVCGICSASSWLPLNLHPLPLKTERGMTDKVKGTSLHR